MGSIARVCGIEGCENKIYARGFCRKHYEKYLDLGVIKRLDPNKPIICSIEGCDSKFYGKGYCNKHYQRFHKYNDPNYLLKMMKHNNLCIVEGCGHLFKGKGYCDKHLQQIRIKGAPYKTLRDFREPIINIKNKTAMLPIGVNAKDAYFIIDLEDIWLAEYKFHLRSGSYVRCWFDGSSNAVNRLIMGVSDPNLVVDHKDGDTLNNRRGNLRICKQIQNSYNTKIRKDNTSGFKGVFKRGSKWRAMLRYNNKLINLGTFPIPKQAAQAYDEKARELFGEFGRFNFPKDGEMPAR